MPVDVLVAIATVATRAAQHATETIPIVFVNVSEPVERGIVASLARPGANVTGVAYQPMQEINQKRFQLFMEAVPQMARVAVLWNPNTPASPTPALPLVEQAARALGVPLHVLAVRDPTELEQAFHAITAAQDQGLFVIAEPFISLQRGRIIQFALEHRLPTTFPESPLLEAGGLMSYGANPAEQYRRAAVYVDKILRGARPTDLPVEQPMKLELVINLKTAQVLGLTIPATVLFQADRVIK
jgi:putative ABC transport system substrate-binding protein